MERLCLHLVKGEDRDYCLKLKVEGSCPKNCPRKVMARFAHISEVEEKKFNINCLHFTRIQIEQEDSASQPRFYCTLFEQENPLCEVCEIPHIVPNFEEIVSQLEAEGKEC